jgi:hypothetical protein
LIWAELKIKKRSKSVVIRDSEKEEFIKTQKWLNTFRDLLDHRHKKLKKEKE